MIIKKSIKNLQQERHVSHGDFEYHKSDLVTYGAEAKSCRIACYTLPPKKSAYPYHYHTQSEESFYILSGEGVFKTPDGDIPVSEGDFVFFPSNENGAHRLTNTSDSQMLVYLDFDTMVSMDVVFYPDSKKVGIYGGGIGQIYKTDTQTGYYDGE